MSTMQRVRQAISQSHDAIELTDFAKSLIDGRITREAYGLYLGQMHEIHRVLEECMPLTPEVSRYFLPSMVRTAAIEADLQALNQNLSACPILPETSTLIRQIIGWSKTVPFALLGSLYILEGSRMGSMLIGRALIKTLNLKVANTSPAEASGHSADDTRVPGVQYHLEDATQTPRRVKELKAAIDAAELDNQREQELTLGACIFMQSLLQLYRALPVTLATEPTGAMRCPFTASATLGGAPLSALPNLRSA